MSETMGINNPEELNRILGEVGSRAKASPPMVIDESGKQVNIPDYDSFMSFLMQAAQVSQLVKLNKHFADRTSAGKTENFPLNITPVPQEVRCTYPAQSLFLINDGPGQIFVAINFQNETPTPLLITETMAVDFETHKLERFYVWSTPGTVAIARALTKY